MSDPAPPPPTQIRTQLQLALAHLNRKQLVQAEGLLTHILKLQPDEPDALQLLGALRRVQGRMPEAEALYRRSLAANPNQPAVHHNLGNLLAALARHQEALAAQQEAVRLKPNYADAWLNLGLTQASLGDFEGAETSYRTVLRMQPNYLMAKQSLIGALNSLKRAKEAEDVARATLTPDIRDKRAIAALEHNLGVSLALQGRHEEAIALFDHAEELVPKLARASYNRATSLQQLGRIDEAVENFRKALAVTPLDMPLHRDLNNLLYAMDDSAFLRSYDDVTAVAPGAAAPILDKAAFLLSAERFDEARESFERGISLNPQNVSGHDGLGLTLANLGDFDGAIRAHEQAVHLEPENAPAWANFAFSLLRAGDARKTLGAASRALAIDSANQLALALSGLAWRSVDETRDAELNDYDNFVQIFDLEPPDGFRDTAEFHSDLNKELDRLHAAKREFVDQTLRGGTQTFADLFNASHPLVESLRARIDQAIGAYLARMRADEHHPFLSRRQRGFAYTGSWSSRLKDCGFHTNHIHHKGWISSVYYTGLPESVEDEKAKQGWLKFGEPPFESGFTDPIRRHVQPKVGRLVLFPSFMWHGTVPFHSSKTRTTIAFDAVPR